jgi:hypothetical protein
MIVDFNKHTWVHQGNINKVKKLIMEVEEFQRIRIEAMEKKIREQEILIREQEILITQGFITTYNTHKTLHSLESSEPLIKNVINDLDVELDKLMDFFVEDPYKQKENEQPSKDN